MKPSLLAMMATICMAMITGGQAMAQTTKNETAIFAGGCFWCMHAAFESLPGVTHVASGYTGGDVVNPTYEQVSSGETGHVEAIRLQDGREVSGVMFLD